MMAHLIACFLKNFCTKFIANFRPKSANSLIFQSTVLQGEASAFSLSLAK